VVTKPPSAAALRAASKVVRAIRRNVAGQREACVEEIAECPAFAGRTDLIMSKIAIERLLEHCQACGMVLMIEDGTDT
jgi:hypothetical protein